MTVAGRMARSQPVEHRPCEFPEATARRCLQLSSRLWGRCSSAAPRRAPRSVCPASSRRTSFRPLSSLPFFHVGSKSAEVDTHGVHSPQQQQPHPPTFSLPLAVELAGASFESYLQPQGGTGFQLRSVRGPTVTFTDKTFLTETYKGVVFVELRSADNLRPADAHNGLSDPYAVISLGGGSVRSRTMPASLNPTWNEQYCMYIRDPATEILRVRLYDEDVAKSDDDLGATMLGLGELAESKGEARTYTLPLRGTGAGSGATVTLRCRLLTFADADPDEVASLTSTVTTAPSPSAVAGLQVAAAVVAAVPSDWGAVVGSLLPKAEGETAAATSTAASEVADGEVTASNGGRSSGSHGSGATVTLPSGEEVPNPWRVLAEMVGRAVGAEALTPVAFVENEETDTQAWLYRNVEAREAVIAFRGTEQIKWKDFVTDLNLAPCSLNPERLDDNAGLPFTARIVRAIAGVHQKQLMVHKGFLDAYDSVRRAVFMLLDEITGSGEKGDSWRVLVTGHSLGGALATLAAYELAERRTPARAVQSIVLYTFGAPRVGNKAFAEEFDVRVPDAWRVTNRNDIIPSVPRLMGYCHVGHAVRLGSDGELRIGHSTAESTDVFGEGRAGVDVIQEIISKLNGEEARPWDEVYSEIAERELQLLDALVGGSGLEEHMETFYLASLQRAVQLHAGAGEAAAAAEGRDKGEQAL